MDQGSSTGIGSRARASVRPGWTNGPLVAAPGEKNSPGETMPPSLGVVKERHRVAIILELYRGVYLGLLDACTTTMLPCFHRR